jgi:SIR2-like domain
MAVILFIGSGVSTHLGMPGWGDLLETLARKHLSAHDSREIALLLNSGREGREYLAATRLAEKMGEDLLEKRLTAFMQSAQLRVDKDPDKRARLLRTRAMLAKSRSIGIITTNWDTLLAQREEAEIVWPQNADLELPHLARISSCLEKSEHFVWHLHGRLGSPGLVITDAQRTRREKSFQRHLDYLNGMLRQHKLVVIGSGFKDRHITELFGETIEYREDEKPIRVLLSRSDRNEARARLGDKVWSGVEPRNFGPIRDFGEGLVEFINELDPSTGLIRLDLVPSAERLVQQLIGQRYSYDTLRKVKENAIDLKRLTDLSARALVEAVDSRNFDAAGIAATLLATCPWSPTGQTLLLLKHVFRRMYRNLDVYDVKVMEPLAFALARSGLDGVGRDYLRAALHVSDVQGSDYRRIAMYYEVAANQAAAYRRHFQERRHQSFLSAWDLPRLLVELESEPFSNLHLFPLPLIRGSIKSLAGAGMGTWAGELDAKVTRLVRWRRGNAVKLS